MDKTDPPESFGIFKPVGHTVVAFRRFADLEAASTQLLAHGFTASSLVRYTPEEMTAQVDLEIERASPMAGIGQELNLVKAHRKLAVQGCCFLVVDAPDDVQAEHVATIARGCHAVAAQRYGRFIIEEVIDEPGDEEQVFESSDRGLDLNVPGATRR